MHENYRNIIFLSIPCLYMLEFIGRRFKLNFKLLPTMQLFQIKLIINQKRLLPDHGLILSFSPLCHRKSQKRFSPTASLPKGVVYFLVFIRAVCSRAICGGVEYATDKGRPANISWFYIHFHIRSSGMFCVS